MTTDRIAGVRTGDAAQAYAVPRSAPVLRFRHTGRPWTLNAERSSNRWEHRAQTSQWREAFGWIAAARRVRLDPPVWVIACVESRDGTVADTGNNYPAVKAALDGLVDAEVIPGDTREYVCGIVMLPPVVTGVDALTLTLAHDLTPEALWTPEGR